MNCWLSIGFTWGAFLHGISVTVAVINCFLSAPFHGDLDSKGSRDYVVKGIYSITGRQVCNVTISNELKMNVKQITIDECLTKSHLLSLSFPVFV